jgi:glutaminase
MLTGGLLSVPCPQPIDGCFATPAPRQLEAVVARYLWATSLEVTASRLALMGATLANGGVNPRTHERALHPDHVADVLSAMVTAGMYDASGEWLTTVGVPTKSGVSGNVLAVVPGRFALAVFSPPLDPVGNSVRGVRVITELSQRWGLHLLAR